MRAEISGLTLETIPGSFDFTLGGSEVTTTPNGENEEVGRIRKSERDAQNSFMEAAVTVADLAAADLSAWDQE
ncbi:hypothetical protein [Streptomyces sp. NPDC050988]|uniref:hypothetical protein n=1 Tax=Streptomyces sp. NPDC050988 TaxID=3365637 RepID=UPI0037A21691